jgi:hypothetical protein
MVEAAEERKEPYTLWGRQNKLGKKVHHFNQ